MLCAQCFHPTLQNTDNKIRHKYIFRSTKLAWASWMNTILYYPQKDKYHALKRPLFLCYVDFKSAFDYINRHALLFKLMTQGFTGKIFEILRDLFRKAKSRVKWNSKIGELFENTCGVLQGGTICPTLFNAYIEDMQLYFAGNPESV